MTLDLAIIIGSTYTSIFLSGQGVVLKEPTIAATSADGRRIKAAGVAAYAMMGKTTDKTVLVSPVKNGVIVQPDIAAQMLKQFILRLYPKSFILRPRINAVAGIPAGLAGQDCNVFCDVLKSAGINGNVFLVPKIMMAAVGTDLPVSSAHSTMTVSLGGGTSEMAVIALSGIISSGAWGITIGGEMMDRAICDYIAGKYNLKISLAMAQKAKESIGSLYENDTVTMSVKGLDLSSKMPASVTVTAADIREVVAPYYLRIADVIETAVNGCGPEISCDILRSGIYLTGGSALIPGLRELLQKRLELKVNIEPRPELAAIVGGGKLLKNRTLLDDILG